MISRMTRIANILRIVNMSTLHSAWSFQEMENLGQKRRMGFQRLDDDVSDKHFISIVGALVDLLLEGGVIHLWGSHQSDISQFIKRFIL
jgi:hypothetical protein